LQMDNGMNSNNTTLPFHMQQMRLQQMRQLQIQQQQRLRQQQMQQMQLQQQRRRMQLQQQAMQLPPRMLMQPQQLQRQQFPSTVSPSSFDLNNAGFSNEELGDLMASTFGLNNNMNCIDSREGPGISLNTFQNQDDLFADLNTDVPSFVPAMTPSTSNFLNRNKRSFDAISEDGIDVSDSLDTDLENSLGVDDKENQYDESGNGYESDGVNDDGAHDRRFRPYQAGQWTEKFAELCEYRKKMGHCLVPHTYNENLALARWVKRQRYQYKLMVEGKASTMTEDRVKALEDIGFVWDSQGAAWGDRLEELRQFKEEFSHCNVPSNYSENPRLATWIKCQRRQYKLYTEGKPSNMTPQRVNELEKLGFEWELRSYKKVKTN
jgi:hypothetical protein